MSSIIEVIEDYTRMKDWIDGLACAIENDDTDIPNHIPLLNDSLLTDLMSKISDTVRCGIAVSKLKGVQEPEEKEAT